MTLPSTPTVSIIIATRDRSGVLEQCLQHIMKQEGEHLEVIVVDNSLDQQSTLAVIGRFPMVDYVRADPSRRNLALMRNIGIQASHGDILSFVDDDALIAPGWLRALVDAFSNPLVGGVTGRVIEEGARETATAEIGRFSLRGEITSNFNSVVDYSVEVDFLYGCNMAVTRKALEKTGAFDPWFGITYEEHDLSSRIRKAGYKLVFVPLMVAQHLLAPRSPEITQRSDNLNNRSLYRTCRSLAYLNVSHYGLSRTFARVAFLNLPKSATRTFLTSPRLTNLVSVAVIIAGGGVGYAMAFMRYFGLHRPPTLQRNQTYEN